MQFKRLSTGEGDSFEVVRHAGGAIHDADFFLAPLRIAESILSLNQFLVFAFTLFFHDWTWRLVDNVADVGKSGRLEQVTRHGDEGSL